MKKGIIINLTFIEFSSNHLFYLMDYFNLDRNKDKIYIMIIDSPSGDPMAATNNYNFNLLTANGTKLNISEIKEDLFIKISIPIKNYELANFKYEQYLFY